MSEPMPPNVRAELETLLVHFAAADAELARAAAARRDALFTCVHFVQCYAVNLQLQQLNSALATDKKEDGFGLQAEQMLYSTATKVEVDLRAAGANTFTPRRYERIHSAGCQMDKEHFGNCAPAPETMVEAASAQKPLS